MDRTLTIVARDPAAGRDDVWNAGGDGQLQSMLDALAARPDPAHVVLRAASVQELRRALERGRELLGGPPALIQLIGHGAPGVLKLGHGAWPDPPARAGISYVLDSDPRSFGPLRGQVAPPSRVLLLGCVVGSVDASTAANGATLLFALAQMWDCEVAAPVDWVTARDLDARGCYRDDDASRRRLSVARRYAVTLGISDEVSERSPAPRVPPATAPD